MQTEGQEGARLLNQQPGDKGVFALSGRKRRSLNAGGCQPRLRTRLLELWVSRRAPRRAWRAEGEGRAASGFRASLHPARGEDSTGRGTRRHLRLFFFFSAFIMKTKQMPQEKGP